MPSFVLYYHLSNFQIYVRKLDVIEFDFIMTSSPGLL